MPTETVENYLKAIYVAQRDADSGEASVAGLASALGVTKGTVTSMVRKLTETGLADSERYAGIRLTAEGQRLALDVIRRHRLIEVFLVQKLGFDWAEVHEEAERLEHAMSRKLLDRLDAYLGHPAIDPHGDPIPAADGTVAERGGVALSELRGGESATVVRLGDEDPTLLEFAARHGIVPGAPISMMSVNPGGGTVLIRTPDGESVALSCDVAQRITVRRG
ncbi:MAG: metal-dependent transcriptional regulator [Planctomycetota bacterium]